MASSFFTGSRGSWNTSARPRIAACPPLAAASLVRGPGRFSRLAPGWRRAGWMVRMAKAPSETTNRAREGPGPGCYAPFRATRKAPRVKPPRRGGRLLGGLLLRLGRADTLGLAPGHHLG